MIASTFANNKDETTFTLPAVFIHIHRRRQDWLDPYLRSRPLPRLPVAVAETLTPCLASQDVPTVEVALGALAWGDQPAP